MVFLYILFSIINLGVRNEVDMVMSSLRSWTQTGYGLGLPPMVCPNVSVPSASVVLVKAQKKKNFIMATK